MKTLNILSLFCSLTALAVTLLPAAERPNVVIIYGDDVGYGDRGHDGSGPYRGGKYQIYEGGTRVPFIVKWPGKVKPGKSDAMVSQIDFVASFAELLEVPLAEGESIDSRSSLSALLGKSAQGQPYMIEEASYLCSTRWGSLRREVQTSSQAAHSLGSTC